MHLTRKLPAWLLFITLIYLLNGANEISRILLPDFWIDFAATQATFPPPLWMSNCKIRIINIIMYLFMIFSCIGLQILLIYWVFTINRRIYPVMVDQCRYYLIIHWCVSCSPGLILIYLTPLLRWLLVYCLIPSTTPDHGGYHIYNILCITCFYIFFSHWVHRTCFHGAVL